jgi:predicted enzyme related to lactoylglutathione lyase
VLKWKVSKWKGPIDYWLDQTGEADRLGIDGGIIHRMKQGNTYNALDTPSLDECIEKKVGGGEVVSSRTVVPGVDCQGYCADTEGNVFGIMKEDSSGG